MPDGDLPENGRNKRKKAAPVQTPGPLCGSGKNYFARLLSTLWAVEASESTIISEFTQIPLDVHFVCVLIVGSVELLSFIPMAFSFFKLRSSEKTKKTIRKKFPRRKVNFVFLNLCPCLNLNGCSPRLKMTESKLSAAAANPALRPEKTTT